MKDQCYVGLKAHLRYHTLPSEIADDQITKMGELDLPFIAMHVADPPEDLWYVPGKIYGSSARCRAGDKKTP